MRHLMKKHILILLFFSCMISSLEAKKVGLCIVATGKYIHFIPQLVKSARKHFCKAHQVTFFVFTDGKLPKQPDIVTIHQNRLGWPQDTLMRFSIYLKNQTLLSKMDYLFAIDADMRFVGSMGDEILSRRVATQHPGYVNRTGTYERKRKSTACVRYGEGKHYFAGGFYGGSSQEFLRMAQRNTTNIKKDLDKNYIALWHDESHLNRYFIDYKPTKMLDPRYCCPEQKMMEDRKLLALDKNHSEMRRGIGHMDMFETEITEADFEDEEEFNELIKSETSSRSDQTVASIDKEPVGDVYAQTLSI